MVQMVVSAQEANQKLSRPQHKTFQQGRNRYWQTYTDKNGTSQATAQSICWLFCWAATGGGSEVARSQARQVFDEIFDTPYDSLSLQLPLEKARKCRYLNRLEQKNNFYSPCKFP